MKKKISFPILKCLLLHMKMGVGILGDVGHDLCDGVANILPFGVRVKRCVARRVLWMHRTVLTFTFMTATFPWVGWPFLSGKCFRKCPIVSTSRRCDREILGGHSRGIDARFSRLIYDICQFHGLGLIIVSHQCWELWSLCAVGWSGIMNRWMVSPIDGYCRRCWPSEDEIHVHCSS